MHSNPKHFSVFPTCPLKKTKQNKPAPPPPSPRAYRRGEAASGGTRLPEPAPARGSPGRAGLCPPPACPSPGAGKRGGPSCHCGNITPAAPALPTAAGCPRRGIKSPQSPTRSLLVALNIQEIHKVVRREWKT